MVVETGDHWHRHKVKLVEAAGAGSILQQLCRVTGIMLTIALEPPVSADQA